MDRMLSLPLVLIAISTGDAVADDVMPEVLGCRAIQSNTDRLTCYDRIGLLLASEDLDSAEGTVDVASDQLGAERFEHAGEEYLEEIVQAPDSAEDTVDVASDQLRAEPLEHDDGEESTRVTGTITRVQKLGFGYHQLTIDNGQIWREARIDPRVRYSVGDTVVINRGFLGSHKLKSEATGIHIAVKRVN